MAKRLTEFLDPRTLGPSLDDIAQAVKRPVETVCVPTDKDWKWGTMFYAVVEGEGAIFGSYRAVACWVEAMIQMLTSCNDWQTLEAMIAATVAELERYPYREAHKQQLREVLALATVRLEELKAQAAGLIRAWNWARGWALILKACPNESSLNIALQLYKTQNLQSVVFTDAIASVVQIGRQHREYLRGFKTA